MAEIIQAIGVVSGILGIVNFGISNFKDTTEPGSTIKLAIALDGEPGGTTDAGGDLPDVRVFNNFGEFKGMVADPGHVDDGSVGTIEIDHENQGVYSLFSANNDAICIAWATVSWSEASGGNKFAVSGDYGEACGGTWFESNMWTDTDQSYMPKCFWIDANGDQPKTGFQVRWPRFAAKEFDEANTDPANICNDIDFGFRTEQDPSVVNFWVPGKQRREQNDRRMRARREVRAPWTASQLVISDNKQHSANRLCDSETSMGPDFAHTGERVFCDMGAKIKYPFCDESNNGTTTCFDAETQHLTGTEELQRRAIENPYARVRDWRS
ncbi:hypothetical protein BJY04DRAFT_80531 [Aspergillus karnatakaensis]|uniref:uncharacterized protein n=1 Tax=Aspergillus karnatakaensis TaxID=1810916 RepID=UPI003CCD2995